jgi:hypothetical protein
MFRISTIVVSVVVLAACSGSGVPADSPGADGAKSAAAAAPMASQAPTTDSAPTPQGDCDLLSADEISAAFGGKLTVIRTSGSGERGSSCTYSVAEVPEGQLMLQAGDEASYLARKQSYSSYGGVTMEPMAFGKEAYLVNGAQAIVLGEDGKSINLALSLVTFDTPLPVTEEQTRSGISLLAKKVMARL